MDNKKKYLKGTDIKSVVCDSDSQEVTIQFDREGIAHMYVSYNPWITKMRKKVEEDPDTFKCVCAGYLDGNPTGYFFEFPSKLVNIRSKQTERSEETKIAASERFKKLHAEGKIGKIKKV